MKKKMIRSGLIVLTIAILVSLGLCALLINLTAHSSSEDEADTVLGIYLAEWEKTKDQTVFSSKPDGANFRLTLIAAADSADGSVKAGQVLADSDRNPADMENHLGRAEIASAIGGERESFVRWSDTLGAKMLYLAKLSPVKSAEGVSVVLRVAIPVSYVDGYFFGYFMFSIVAILLVGGILTILLVKLAQRAAAPLNVIRSDLEDVKAGTYRKKFKSSSDDEIDGILLEIGEIAGKIDESLKQLKEEKVKLDFIVDHLKEGIIALNRRNEVVLINVQAKRLFKFRSGNLGKDIAFTTSNPAILDSVSSAEGDWRAFELEFGESVYSVTVNSVRPTPESIVNKIIVLSDVTAKRNSEEMREQFFSNASHELKTPITSIRGFSELMSGETDPERLAKYASRIHTDSTRIMNLLSDMLKLTKLDQSFEDEKLEDAELSELCETVGRDALPRLEAKKMTFSVEGTKKIRCYPGKTRDLIANLVDNAIKYSNEGGSVRIKLTNKFLSVSDSGIGIEKKHLNRLFERFFMVDSSRSKKEGGTGLGLSIVKHICRIQSWTPRVESEFGKGTTVTIVF